MHVMHDYDDRIPPEMTVDEEPFDLEALDTALALAADAEAPEQAQVVQRWAITDDDLAEWAMSHVAQIDAGMALLDEQTQARLDRIKRHRDAAAKRLADRRSFFEAHLVQYARAHRERDPKRNKTLSLPSGDVRSTESKPAAAVADDEMVAEWIEAHAPDDVVEKAVNRTTKVYVGPFRKLVKLADEPTSIALALDCHHIAYIGVDGQDVPDEFPCMECDPDPLDGRPISKVTASKVETTKVVVDAAGNKIPGTTVTPSNLTFSVKPS